MFNAATVAVGQSSDSIDISSVDHVTVLMTGSSASSFGALDIHLSADGGTTWVQAAQVYPGAMNGAGNTMATRQGMNSLATYGCNALRVVAQTEETLTVTVVGR